MDGWMDGWIFWHTDKGHSLNISSGSGNNISTIVFHINNEYYGSVQSELPEGERTGREETLSHDWELSALFSQGRVGLWLGRRLLSLHVIIMAIQHFETVTATAQSDYPEKPLHMTSWNIIDFVLTSTFACKPQHIAKLITPKLNYYYLT